MGAVLGFEYAPEFAEQVRRIFHGDAPGGVVPAGITLASDRPEWAILRGEFLWDMGVTVAALAANFSGVTARQNTPNRVTVVEDIWIVNANASTTQRYRIGLSFSTPTPLATVKASPRDGRRGPTFQPSTTGITYQDATGFLLARGPIVVPPNTTVLLKPVRGYVLQPLLSTANGPTSLIVQGDVVNQDVQVYFFGYERALRAEEKFEG
jgi:hypothetical protein